MTGTRLILFSVPLFQQTTPWPLQSSAAFPSSPCITSKARVIFCQGWALKQSYEIAAQNIATYCTFVHVKIHRYQLVYCWRTGIKSQAVTLLEMHSQYRCTNVTFFPPSAESLKWMKHKHLPKVNLNWTASNHITVNELLQMYIQITFTIFNFISGSHFIQIYTWIYINIFGNHGHFTWKTTWKKTTHKWRQVRLTIQLGIQRLTIQNWYHLDIWQHSLSAQLPRVW